ncbi:uncharacterized protein LOC107038078 [Diachasma alloeum]|uniref:uncharacterized protein LOC107038078 n=1 Tax=Diachasma alloeum TaxID=454923 RepID=UPI00073847F0|nr:uncharacterized protein LOC107038078 [Diachasma alloeum]
MSELTIDNALLEKIIRKYKEDATVEVAAVDYKALGAKGGNYTSAIQRIVVKYTVEGDGDDAEKELSLFMKYLHIQESEAVTAMLQNVYQYEMGIMTEPLKHINQMLTVAYVPRLLYFHLEEPYFVILEDLMPLGFTMASRATGLDLPHSLVAIRGLAEFHGSSVAVYEKMPEYRDTFKLSTLDDPNQAIYQLFNHGLISLETAISGWEELGPRYAEKLRSLRNVLFEKCKRAFGRRENEFTVLNHGDCTQLNMLFAYDDNKKPTDVALVDFQMTAYNSPAVDLRTFMSSSVTQDVYQHHEYSLLEEYHSVLSETMKNLHCKTPIPSLEEIEKMYDDRAFISVISTCIVYPIIHAPASDVLPLDDMLSDRSEDSGSRYEEKHFKELLIARLIEFDQRGLLES